jgi:hypothetical protein
MSQWMKHFPLLPNKTIKFLAVNMGVFKSRLYNDIRYIMNYPENYNLKHHTFSQYQLSTAFPFHWRHKAPRHIPIKMRK